MTSEKCKKNHLVAITLFKIEKLPMKNEVINRLHGKKKNGCWLKAKQSKYNENEIEIDRLTE